MRRRRQKGQALVEGALVLIVFLGVLIAIFDVGQVFFAHQFIAERARKGVRWASVQPSASWSTTETQIKNVILCGRPTCSSTIGAFGLTATNITVTRNMVTTADDEQEWRINISVDNFQFRFFGLWQNGSRTSQVFSVSIPYETPMSRV